LVGNRAAGGSRFSRLLAAIIRAVGWAALESGLPPVCIELGLKVRIHLLDYVLTAEDRRTWRVQQMLVDPEEHHDWVAEFEVDLARSHQTS
jgi:hypothetical protein